MTTITLVVRYIIPVACATANTHGSWTLSSSRSQTHRTPHYVVASSRSAAVIWSSVGHAVFKTWWKRVWGFITEFTWMLYHPLYHVCGSSIQYRLYCSCLSSQARQGIFMFFQGPALMTSDTHVWRHRRQTCGPWVLYIYGITPQHTQVEVLWCEQYDYIWIYGIYIRVYGYM